MINLKRSVKADLEILMSNKNRIASKKVTKTEIIDYDSN